VRTKPNFWKSLYQKCIPRQKTVSNLRYHNLRLETFLRAMPIEYCGWSSSETQALSHGFCEMLGTASLNSVEDIQECILPGDAEALDSLFSRLEEYQESFDLSVVLKKDKRVIKFFGTHGTVPEQNEETFNILWAQDISEFVKSALDKVEALDEAEKREKGFLEFLDALPFPLWSRNKNLDISWVNRAYTHVVNANREQVISKQVELSASKTGKKTPKTLKGTRTLGQEALKKQEVQAEHMHLVMDGSRRMVEIHETPLNKESTLGSLQDITRVEELEAELKYIVDANNEALEQLRTAIAIFDMNMHLDFYNPAYEQLWGLDSKWLNSKPKLSEVLDKLREKRRLPEQADFKQFKKNWDNWFTSLLSPHEEMLYLPDNSVLRMVVVPRPTGGLLMTYEDVTSRLELETSYNMLVDVQQETLDNLAEGLVVFGQDGRLKLWNPVYMSIWDLQPEDLEGSPHISELVEKTEDFFDPSDWERARKELVNNGLERKARKGRILRDDSTMLEYSIVPLPDGNVLNTYFDITDTVKVEEVLIEKNAALEEAEKLKSDFLANVSYQLRTPLNTMMGFAEILNEQYFGELNKKQSGYTESMIEAGNKLVSLIDNILDLSAIEAGYMQITPEEVDVKKVVQSVFEVTEDWARQQNIKLVKKISTDVDVISVDTQRFRQVLLNLISNAIHFSDKDTKITVHASIENQELVLKVVDQGGGIPQEDLEQVFLPFIHAQEKQQKRGGAGLGLTLVKNITQLHGGRVEISSEMGKGTTVTCIFPMNINPCVTADEGLSPPTPIKEASEVS